MRAFCPRAPLRLVTALSALGLTSGCSSLAREEGLLPDAVRAGITRLSAQGYPDLTKVPAVPKTLPSDKAWQNLERTMVSDGKALAKDPLARPLLPEETDLLWADRARAAINADSRAVALPLDGVAPGQGADWAAEARAKLEADIAALPPL